MSQLFSRPRRARAQGLVEFALVIPMFVLIVCAMIDFARVYNAQETLHRLTKEAVNTASKIKSDGTRPTTAEVSAFLMSSVLPPLDAAQVVVKAVDAAKVDATGRHSVYVQVGYNLPLLTPMLDRFFPQAQARLDSVAQLPYPRSRPGRASPPPDFTIDVNGGIIPNSDMGALIKVLGKQITYGAGGPSIPVTVQMKIASKQNGNGHNKFNPIFGGNPVNGGEQMNPGTIAKGDTLAFSANADYSSGKTTYFDATYASDAPVAFQDDATHYHVLVLKNGDVAPDKPGFSGQTALATYIAPYVDTGTHRMVLGRDDAIILWEFNPNYNSAAADFQDLAMLVQLTPASSGNGNGNNGNNGNNGKNGNGN